MGLGDGLAGYWKLAGDSCDASGNGLHGQGQGVRFSREGARAYAAFDGRTAHASPNEPLRIGFGPQDRFGGRMREVRLHSRALGEAEIETLSAR
jgi:hypothetical protein